MKNKIIDYTILTEDNTAHLSHQINKMIEIGYQPYGNLIYEDEWYIQPMVKYQSDKINVENKIDVNNDLKGSSDSSLKYTLETLLGEK